MKGREGKGPPSTDLLVCFPSRAHLTLMPKPICSPARTSEFSKRHHHHHHHKKASPQPWSKSKNSEISEPTSPKVTCAGQIKVRPKPTSSCKNWQSVMEEIERLHNKNSSSSNKHKNKKPHFMEALGFKKEVMQFLTCLRNIKFEFRCFGSFPTPVDITSDEDEDDDDEEEEDFQANDDTEEGSKTVFSKWFMVMQENQKTESTEKQSTSNDDDDDDHVPSAPPPNALLLMRCRSAPAKSWLQERHEQECDDDEEQEEEEEEEVKTESDEEKKAKTEQELENKREKESLVVMRCGSTDFYKLSADIAKETWVVSGVKDPLSRSRSWKR